MIIRLIKLEFSKLFRRGFTYIGFGAILVIVLIIQAGMYFEGQKLLDLLVMNLSDVFELHGDLINVYTVSYIIMNSLWIHIPILVAILSGDMLSGEATRGTFRLLLTRPVSRLSLLTAKYITAQLYTAMLVIFLMLVSLGAGRLIYHSGDMIVLLSTINIFSDPDVLWRFFSAFGYGIISMWVVSGLAFLFSGLSSNSLSSILNTMAVIIVFSIVSNFSLGIFNVIKPFLFTSYLNGWMLFFDEPVQWTKIIQNIAVLLLHITAFYLITILVFRKKDITS
ncbi:MAG TPA: ABC transporter permease subunit [Bacteroidales bacterium]|nr:ABC transporter permease subunit [Bacteroidales bacterium]